MGESMRVLVISDTHGREENLMRLMEKEGAFDLTLHLGDAEGHGRIIQEIVKCPLELISGNNDFDITLPKDKVINMLNYQVMLTHGHHYYLFMGRTMLADAARVRGCQIVFYGHTHRPMIEEYGNVLVMNPGSLSLPRQENGRPSYIVMDINEDDLTYEIRYL